MGMSREGVCMLAGGGGEGVHSYRWQHMCDLLPATRVSHDLSALLVNAQEQEQGGCSLLRGYNMAGVGCQFSSPGKKNFDYGCTTL